MSRYSLPESHANTNTGRLLYHLEENTAKTASCWQLLREQQGIDVGHLHELMSSLDEQSNMFSELSHLSGILLPECPAVAQP